MAKKLIVVSGPAGVGKGTIVKAIVKKRDDVVESVSCTTRAPRPGETHGKEYYFISQEEFLRRIEAKDFLEYDQHFGNYYGTPKSFVKEQLKEKTVILEIDVMGALFTRKAFPDCVMVMIAPPSIEELKRRLIGRGTETEQQISDRLSRIEYELAKKTNYDYVIVNDVLEDAIAELERIIDK